MERPGFLSQADDRTLQLAYLKERGKKSVIALLSDGPKGPFGDCFIQFAEKTIEVCLAVYGFIPQDLIGISPIRSKENMKGETARQLLGVAIDPFDRKPTNLDDALTYARSGGEGNKRRKVSVFTQISAHIKEARAFSKLAKRFSLAFLERALTIGEVQLIGSTGALLSSLKLSEHLIRVPLDELIKRMENLRKVCEDYNISPSQIELATDALFLRNKKTGTQKWEKAVQHSLIDLIVDEKWELAKEYRDYLYENFARWFPEWRQTVKKANIGNPPDLAGYFKLTRERIEGNTNERYFSSGLEQYLSKYIPPVKSGSQPQNEAENRQKQAKLPASAFLPSFRCP